MGFSVNRRISLRSPTCAGKRAWPYRPPTSGRDHPRVCGEKGQVLTTSEIKKGSPPRVRGKVVVRLVLGHSLGITPACAGKRPIPPSAACAATGITPACAGKRCVPSVQRLHPWDHPRVCGEKTRSCSQTTSNRGSPPRVRGKDLGITNAIKSYGITPACAGKRLCAFPPPDSTWDHPRVCGEKNSEKAAKDLGWGSPPRVRGKEGGRPEKGTQEGITPACAGKSNGAGASVHINWDHPRVCGEKRWTGNRISR